MSKVYLTPGSNYNEESRILLDYADAFDGDLDLDLEVTFLTASGEPLFLIQGDTGIALTTTVDEMGPPIETYYNPSSGGFLYDFGDRRGDVLLEGGNFGDVLFGGAGNDVLEGGAGNDILDAGDGNDTLSYAQSAAAVTVSLADLTVSGGDAAGDQLSGFENLLGSAHYDVLSGNDANNVIEGGAGADILDGRGGNDTLSYAHSAQAVVVGLENGFTSGGDAAGDQFAGFENLLGSAFNDQLIGDDANNVIEGGGSGDFLNGNGGIDTLSYAHSATGVDIGLDPQFGSGFGGDAAGDTVLGFENLLGSAHADTLSGNFNDNTLNGNGGGDQLYGMGGNDRLVITGTAARVNGGTGTDLLFIKGEGGSVSFTDATFTSIETVYLRGETSVDLSGVTTGTRIVSQTASDLHIVGTSGADRILVDQGSNVIEGGAGGDKLFAGSGADTFHFEAGFGRDNVYGFELDGGHISVAIDGVAASDVVLRSLNGGTDTLVTFKGVETTNKIILHDVAFADVKDVQNELFVFGA